VTQSIARLLLAVLLLGSIVYALHRHGKVVPGYRFHAGIYIPTLVGEALVIWLAGGFG
jgi:hypothetical protein